MKFLALASLVFLPTAFASGAGTTTTAPSAAPVGAFQPAPAGASVSFEEPKDGATVKGEFNVRFSTKGMAVHPAGALVGGTGHHHLVVDGSGGAAGDVVPADATHLHFGKGQTETKLKLAPGPHTLTLQFADGAHRSYGPAMSKTIHITVK
jgi:hypothetical protein